MPECLLMQVLIFLIEVFAVFKAYKKAPKIILISLSAVLLLNGCDSMRDYTDTIKDLFGNEEDGSTSGITIEKSDGNNDEQPVIVIQTDDEPLVISVNEAEEEPEEVVEEDIWDDENKIYSMQAASPDEITLVFVGSGPDCAYSLFIYFMIRKVKKQGFPWRSSG